jgi:hypothetical protein
MFNERIKHFRIIAYLYVLIYSNHSLLFNFQFLNFKLLRIYELKKMIFLLYNITNNNKINRIIKLIG